MGVFFTQVLMTVIALALIVLGLGILSLAMRRNRLQVVPVMTCKSEPCGRNDSAWDRILDSIFAMQTALPSRAPPISSLLRLCMVRLRARFGLPPAGGAGGSAPVPGTARLAGRLAGTRSVHVGKLAFA
jgi:hypothetical protein